MADNRVKNLSCKVEGCIGRSSGFYCRVHHLDRSRDPKTIKRRHHLSGSPEYNAWSGMIGRCNNPKSAGYKNYGGRGITVCKKWRDFREFYADMGPRPSSVHSLERVDVNGNYEPSNCCWATKQLQSVNQRLRSDNTSGYRGVTWASSMNRWMAQIRCDYKNISIGFYEDPAEAAWYRDQYAIQLFGEYAPLNFEYV